MTPTPTRPAWLADYRRAVTRRDQASAQAIEECRPAYQRAMAPKKPTGRPKKSALEPRLLTPLTSREARNDAQ